MTDKNLRRLITFALCVSFSGTVHALSFLNPADPFPMYSSIYPHDFLTHRQRLYNRGFIDDDSPERMAFSVSPFFQTANRGKNQHGLNAQLGDIHGPWSVVGLLYGPVPCGQERGPILDRAFRQAKFCGQDAFCSSITDPAITNTRFMHDPEYADPGQRFGFVSVPLKYRKVGLRFEGQGMLSHDWGVTFKIGVSDITQTLRATLCDEPLDCDDFCCTQTRTCDTGETLTKIIAPGFIDLTPLAIPREFITVDSCSTATVTCTSQLYDGDDKSTIEALLISKLKDVFKEIKLDVCDFHDTSIEDAQFSLFWRHPYIVNAGNKNGYPEYTFTPFATVDVGIGIGREKDPAKAFSVAFGNNGHHALGFTGGFDVDFSESIALGLEAGVTTYFSRDFCDVHVPTNDCQQGVYPYITDIHVEPGNNWHFMGTLEALHFVDRLSFYGAYIYVNHNEDKICILGSNKGMQDLVACKLSQCPEVCQNQETPDTCEVLCGIEVAANRCFFTTEQVNNAFKPKRLAKDTSFNAQLVNGALNYDISPYSTIGFLWQIPVNRRQAYRSTTVLFTFQATF
jgi:hypothetical protein